MRKRKRRKKAKKKTAKRAARKRRELTRAAPRRRRLTLKRAAKALAKMLYVHLVKVPEEEREERIAYVEKAVAKRLEKLAGTKKGSRTRHGKGRRKRYKV